MNLTKLIAALAALSFVAVSAADAAAKHKRHKVAPHQSARLRAGRPLCGADAADRPGPSRGNASRTKAMAATAVQRGAPLGAGQPGDGGNVQDFPCRRRGLVAREPRHRRRGEQAQAAKSSRPSARRHRADETHRHAPPGPAWAGPNECYTDEGYGRYLLCGGGMDM